jgi:alkylation response protein AidB-like acyl-CoA dehydrogenase
MRAATWAWCARAPCRRPDGSYHLNGSKIFISGGEHDLTDNIVHLVLARLPDAPPGPKGLSLFLAPKVLPHGMHATPWSASASRKRWACTAAPPA